MENPVNRLIGRAVTQHAIDTVFLRTFFSKKGGKFGKGEKGKEGGGEKKKERKKIIFYAPGYLHVPNRFLSILKLSIEMIFYSIAMTLLI